MTKIKRIIKYFIHPLEGEDGKLSGKRLLGSILIIFGVRMAWYGVLYCVNNLPDVTMMVGTLLGAGLAFWGITEWGRQQDIKNNPDKNNRKD